ncbi:MAG: response regulator [Nannocystaceae bacterium]|nr:response regulator [Nannocystaceae bacterium]
MQASPTSAVKVLVADDSEAERHAARTTLLAAGYSVVEAFDGQHALEVFARERPDLVLLDVVMPRLTGLEACRILKAKNQSRYLPVIMLSTRNSVNARVEGLRSGADDYLGKPYDGDELVARVEALLRARKVLGGAAEPGAAMPEDSGSESPQVEDAQRRRMEEEFDRAERYSDPLACLRVTADSGLVQNALRSVVESSVRKIDIVFESEDEGFMLLLPNTHFPGALAVAERIWKDARSTSAAGKVTSVSIGVSFYPNRDTHSLQDLVDLVDAALKQAREVGGGKICLYQHQGYLYAPEP